MYAYLEDHLQANEFILIDDIFVKAIASGRLEMVQCILKDHPTVVNELAENDLVLLLKDSAKPKERALQEYLIHDVFSNIIVTQRILEAAARSTIEMFDFLYAQYLSSGGRSAALNIKFIFDASAKSGDFLLVRHIFRKFKVKADQDTLAYATHGNAAMVKYFLHPYFRLSPSGSTIEAASRSRNLLVLYDLLNPARCFNLTVKNQMINEANFVARPFLRANARMREAFFYIARSKIRRAAKKLREAIDFSLTHFFDLVVDVCLYPFRYAMAEEKVALLVGQVDTVLESMLASSKCSFVELDVIYKIFAKASEIQPKELEVDPVFSRWLQKLQAVDERLSCSSSFVLGKR